LENTFAVYEIYINKATLFSTGTMSRSAIGSDGKMIFFSHFALLLSKKSQKKFPLSGNATIEN
jgi:hypothetical protein